MGQVFTELELLHQVVTDELAIRFRKETLGWPQLRFQSKKSGRSQGRSDQHGLLNALSVSVHCCGRHTSSVAAEASAAFDSPAVSTRGGSSGSPGSQGSNGGQAEINDDSDVFHTTGGSGSSLVYTIVAIESGEGAGNLSSGEWDSKDTSR